MNLVAEIMRVLHAKGATMDMIMAAVAVVEQDVERRKAAVREGVRKHRENRANLKTPVTLQVDTGALLAPAPLDPPSLTPDPKPSPLYPPTPLEASASSRPKRKRSRTDYPEDFEKLWEAYPTDAVMSKKEAHGEWSKLDAEDRQAAFDSVPGFVGYCRSNSDYRPVHLCRYLKQRRFENVVKIQQKVAARVFVQVDTDDWLAWKEFGLRTRRRDYPTCQREIDGRIVTGWDFPSAQPPQPKMAAE